MPTSRLNRTFPAGPESSPRWRTDTRGLIAPLQATPVRTRRADAKRQGTFAKEAAAKEAALISSLLSLGLREEARRKARQAEKRNISLDKGLLALLESEEGGEASWRSPWTPLVLARGQGRFQMGKMEQELRKWDEHGKVLAAETITQMERDELHQAMTVAVEHLRKTLAAVRMWSIYVCVEWKKRTVPLNVDSDFTVGMIKHEIQNLMGILPDVQQLFLMPRGDAEPLQYFDQSPRAAPKAKHGAKDGRNGQPARQKSVTAQLGRRNIVTAQLGRRNIVTAQLGRRDSVMALADGAALGTVDISALLGQGRQEMQDNDDLLLHLGIGPGDLIQVDIDEAASKRLQARVFAETFKGMTEGRIFDNMVARAFNRVDLDGSGFLDADEVRCAFENMEVYLTGQQVQRLVEEFDQDGNNEFDLEEFKTMVRELIQDAHLVEGSWEVVHNAHLQY